MKIILLGDVPHEEIAFTLGSLGRGYQVLGDRRNALESFKKAYEIYKQIHGENHSETQEAKADLEQIQSQASLSTKGEPS